MNGALSMSKQRIFRGSHSTTFSQESEDGRSRCASPDGRMIDPSGRDRAHALRSRAPEKGNAALIAKAAMLSRILTRRGSLSASFVTGNGMLTDGISGQSSAGSLNTTTLQLSLENRLRARMAVFGSPEYELRWSNWDMPLGVPICALRASARRISDNACSGWRTPTTGDAKRGVEKDPKVRNVKAGTGSLNNEAAIAGWPTPMAGTPGAGNNDSSRKTEAVLTGWPTPNAMGGGKQAVAGIGRGNFYWAVSYSRRGGRLRKRRLAGPTAIGRSGAREVRICRKPRDRDGRHQGRKIRSRRERITGRRTR